MWGDVSKGVRGGEQRDELRDVRGGEGSGEL